MENGWRELENSITRYPAGRSVYVLAENTGGEPVACSKMGVEERWVGGKWKWPMRTRDSPTPFRGVRTKGRSDQDDRGRSRELDGSY